MQPGAEALPTEYDGVRLILSAKSPTGYRGVTRRGNRFNIRVGRAVRVGGGPLAAPQLTSLTCSGWCVACSGPRLRLLAAPGTRGELLDRSGPRRRLRPGGEGWPSSLRLVAFTAQAVARVPLVRHCGGGRSVLRARAAAKPGNQVARGSTRRRDGRMAWRRRRRRRPRRRRREEAAPTDLATEHEGVALPHPHPHPHHHPQPASDLEPGPALTPTLSPTLPLILTRIP